MQREKTRSKLLTRRAILLAGGKLALLATVAGRLYYLQVLQAGRYSMLADENRINIRLLAPPRGRILDRFGVALATNHPTYRSVLVAEQAGDIGATLDAVSALVPVGDGDRRRVSREIREKHSFVPVMIRENLSWEEMARIEVNTLELPGVSIEQGLTRFYPFGPTASHVVGYVAAVSEKDLGGDGDDPLLELPDFRIGKSGVEKAHDLALRGTAGTSQVEVNAYGKVVRELAREDGMAGQDIVLGLDMKLQDLAVQRCTAQGSAACVMLDAWTGEVLVLASTPGYDPGAFAAGLTPALWQNLISDPMNPLNDKSISGTYAPGSTFKPMMAMAGLEAGAITPDTEFYCPGQFHLGNTVFHCWKKGGHGTLSVRRAIKESCDVFFYHTADLLGIDRIAQMANRFGLGVELGIDIPGEKSGLVPTRAWKLATTGVAWQRGETISCGIGQSFVSVTPLQLAIYAARLATGRVVVPRLLRKQGLMTLGGPLPSGVNPDFAPLGVQQKHLELVLDGMYGVVNEQHGTAYAARITDPVMAMAGKTGTAQVHHITEAEREHGHLTGQSVPWKQRDHALFISFAPASAPRYACAVVVEHGGASGGEGGAVAAPIAHDLMLEAQTRDPVDRVPPQPFEPPTTVAQG
ncbi:MAG TPA: penicillin-binding protein 2 [Stellaceae bacterium]|nr:penicillin-binding protein 2 [Stellaceae bacterium]